MTPKQEKFVNLYLRTGKATQSYRQAYNVKTETVKTSTENASRLLKTSKVAARIAEAHARAAKSSEMSIEKHLEVLAQLRAKAESKNQLSAAIAAEVKRGEVAGYYVNRSENVNHNYAIADRPMRPDDWARQYGSEPEKPN